MSSFHVCSKGLSKQGSSAWTEAILTILMQLQLVFRHAFSHLLRLKLAYKRLCTFRRLPAALQRWLRP